MAGGCPSRPGEGTGGKRPSAWSGRSVRRREDPGRPAVLQDRHRVLEVGGEQPVHFEQDRKSTRLNSSHSQISYAVFCLKKKKTYDEGGRTANHNLVRVTR